MSELVKLVDTETFRDRIAAVTERIGQALAGDGSECPGCGRTSFAEVGVPCWDCQGEQDRRAQRLASVGIPKRFAGLGVESGEIRAWVGRVLDRQETEGILLHGPAGTHKTGNAFAALAALVEPDSRWLAATWAKLPVLMRGMSLDAQRERVAELSRFRGAVLLDDLGAGVSSEWADTVLCMLLDGRHDEMLPTIITTNLSPTKLASSFGDRIASRLSSYHAVLFGGPDSRRRKA